MYAETRARAERGRRLRLLVLSNLYPPYYLGGYELVCRDVTEHLRAQGHAVTVLTSYHGRPGPERDGLVWRHLTLDSRWLAWRSAFRRERQDQAAFRAACAAARPDVIYSFSLHGVPQSLLYLAQRSGAPVVYDLSAEWLEPEFGGDPWLHFWARPAGAAGRGAAKRALRRLLDPWLPTGRQALDLRHTYFTSQHLKRVFAAKGFSVAQASVIYRGVDLARFVPPERRTDGRALRLLFAGRIVAEKGLHTVVEALRRLAGEAVTDLSLTVAGPTQDSAYLRQVQSSLGPLAARVTFRGVVPWEAMPEVYAAHDVYLLPSVWEEPFSIGLLEAMAAGLAVVATPTGGTPEALTDGVNGLMFPPENGAALAEQLHHLRVPELRRRLGAAARKTVEERFGLLPMFEAIEAFLQTAAEAQA